VRGEDALRADRFDIFAIDRSPFVVRQTFVEQFQNQQTRMALVHVEALDLPKTKSPQHLHSTNSKYGFLI